MIETKKLYRPRTQAAALAYAASEAEKPTATLEQYVRMLVFEKMSELEKDLIGEISCMYHGWLGSTAWDYPSMKTNGWRDRLQRAIWWLVSNHYREIGTDSSHWLTSAYAFGYVGFLYQTDALTPPNIRPKANLTRQQATIRLNQAWNSQRGGGSTFLHRLEAQADQLVRELERTLDQSMLQNESLPEVIGRIKKVFGSESKTSARETVWQLKNGSTISFFTERLKARFPADATDEPWPSVTGIGVSPSDTIPVDGNIDDELWSQAVEDLLTAMDWEHRSPGYYVPNGGAAYEVERNWMTEYVRMVRSGQVDAQMPNSEVIEDFVWVAVSDKDECEDCADRQDMTMSDIADKLGDDSAPPLHFNCRCALIPSLPDFQPLAGDWESEDVDPTDRQLTDPQNGNGYYPHVEDFESWRKRL